jgi:DNA polymerase-1
LLRVLSSQKPTHFAVVKDMGRKTFRNDLYPDYKANRSDMPEEMREQLPRLDEMLAASGIPILGREGYEADDLMAYLAQKAEAAGFDVFLVTKDKDMGQIVSDHVKMFQLEKGNEVAIQGPAEILEKFGVPPEQMRDYLSLVGDSSDNVPGVPKVGPKTATELLKEYGSLDGVYANLQKITKKGLHATLSENREKAYLSRELVTLQATHEFGITLGELVFRGVNRGALQQMFAEHELRSLIRQVENVPNIQAAGQQDLFGAVSGLRLETAVTRVKPDYVLVDSLDALEALQEELKDIPLISLDTETDSIVGWKATLVGVCVAHEDSKGYYLPVGHLDSAQNLPPDAVRHFLKFLCGHGMRTLVFHNAKFDIQVLQNFGITLRAKVLDSMLGSWVLDPGQPSFGLDDQVRRRLGHEMIPIEKMIGKGKAQINFAQVPVADACEYGAEDAVYTLRLWKALEPELQKNNLLNVLATQEVALIPCLADMEREGICIDSEELGRIQVDLSARQAHLEREIIELAGGEVFNINSPKQLGVILFEKLGLPVIKKTSTGYSTDASTLDELRGINPIVEAVLSYREVAKLLNTYVEVLPSLVDAGTGRLHTSFMQTGTATGRLSSRDPNLQNIPIRTPEGKRIRAAFVPRSPDWVILSADYSQIELRMLAHLSGDPALCAAYREGQDIHAATASAIFGVTPEQVTSEMRRQSKVVNFGVLYGMTAFRLARDLGIERSAAKTFIDGYFGLYGTVKDWIDGIVQAARAEGAVHTITGRRRVIPGIGSHDHTERQMAERMAVNSPVQGSAADLIKISMIRLHHRIQKDKLPLKMLLQVHDELVLECPREFAAEGARIVKEEMENAFVLKVPLIAQVGQGKNWLEAH